MEEAHAAGMLIGAYHYARPDLGNDAADEARYFVSVAGTYLKEGYLRPALDLEEGASIGKAALSNWVHKWMDTVKSETGIEPIIYVNSNYANNYLDSSVTKYNLWIAHWRCDTGTPPNTGLWADWDFWQYYSPNYCGQNSVPGISGGVDLDIFNGDMSSLYAFVITGGTDDLIPLTGDMYGNDIDITGFYKANTAEFTFGGETARFGQMADKPIEGNGMAYGSDRLLVSSGFDYPVGESGYVTQANDGDGWYNAQDFGVPNPEFGNKLHLGEDRNKEGGYTYITQWGSEGRQFWIPHGVAVDSSGYVFVADTHNNRIQKFDSDGNFITKWGSVGTGDGEFYLPWCIAVDSSGYVYVADT